MLDRSAFYPESIRDGNVSGSLYIYFQSLQQALDPGPQIYKAAVEYINHDIRKANSNVELSEIGAAFQFLDNVIASESLKETAFLNFLNEELGEDAIKYSIPSTNEDWKNFVNTFQNKLHIGDQGIDDLKNELQRLNINKIRYDDGANYIKDDLTKTQTRLEQIFQVLNGAKNQNQGRQLLEGILNRYSKQLFELDSKGNLLKKSDIAGVLSQIAATISEFYTSTFKTKGYTGSNTFNVAQIDKLLNENKELDNKILDLIDRAKSLPFLNKGMVSSLKFDTTNDNFSQQERDILINAVNSSQQGNKLVDSFISSLNGYQIPEESFKVIQVHNAYAEISSLVHFTLSKNSFGGINIGGSGSKPDNLLGYLAVDTSFLDVTKNQQFSDDYQKLEQIYNIISSLATGFKNTNTTQYYKDQYEVWETATTEIQKILNSIDSKVLKFKDCFIIEDSTKSYQSLYGKSKHNDFSTDIHGGSLGANLYDQLSKIEALRSLGAISNFSKDWLYAAILNSGPGMVGYGQKQAIEEYLAAFVGILLFDDQIGIAKESIIKYAENNSQLSKTNVHKLHLFSVNNGYYPLSYVLKLTRDNLQKNYNNLYGEIDKNIESGIRVEIYGHVTEPSLPKDAPPDIYLQTWDSLSAEAKKSTKIRMMFLINFMNVLEGLLSPNV